MKPHLDFLGKRIYLAGEVTVSGFSYPKIYFKVQDYEIFYTIDKFTFSDCTCIHGSFWGINEDDKCRHTAAVRWWIREELQSFMKSQSCGESFKPSMFDSIPPQDVILREETGRNNSEQEDNSVSPCLPETLEAMEEESGDSGESPEPLPFWITKYLDDSKEMREQ